jgi:uncharacterized protein (DUF1800 family)
MPLTALNETLETKRAAHLLRRTTFGATKAQIETFSTLNPQQAISRLFDPSLPGPELPVDPLTGNEWITPGQPVNGSEENELQEYFKGWFIGQMLGLGISENLKLSYSVREKITLFLHTHFTTKQSVVNNSRALYYQNELFRRFAFDKNTGPEYNFRELTKKVCVDNAMLKFLDGRLNVKDNPNENFAREMFELFTIGRGLEGTLPQNGEPGDYFNFTEMDVQAAARVLSGFDTDDDFTVIDELTGLPRGRSRGGSEATQHDFSPKQFSERFDNQVIEPDPALMTDPPVTPEEVALDEISQLIDMIYTRQETARYICRKLYRFFVYHDITLELENDIIADMAQILISNQFKIQPVIEELLGSRHFYEAESGITDNNFGGIIKSPLDLILETVIYLEVPVPHPVTDAGNFYDVSGILIQFLSDQGLDLYEPFEVAGYSAYHQYPVYHRNWISTNYLTRRYDFIQELLSGMGLKEGSLPPINLIDFIRRNYDDAMAGDAEALIIGLISYLLPVTDHLTFNDPDDGAEITAERMRYFRHAFLYSPQIDDDPPVAWNFRWNNLVEIEVVENQLRNLLNAILQSPEYQLM